MTINVPSHLIIPTESRRRWDDTWLGMAAYIAGKKSKDRSTKVGAVIVAPDQAVLSLGWNGFPRAVDDEVEDRHRRPDKYQWTEHAERNAIYNAARRGIALLGSAIYVTQMPCCECARAIIQAGISELVTHEPEWTDPHVQQTQHLDVSREMLAEAGVVVRFVKTSS